MVDFGYRYLDKKRSQPKTSDCLRKQKSSLTVLGGLCAEPGYNVSSCTQVVNCAILFFLVEFENCILCKCNDISLFITGAHGYLSV